jgi:hypothetical protein
VERIEQNDPDRSRQRQARRLAGAEAFRAHLTLVFGLALCAVAFWFELGRAERGNELSWAYVFEWPLLGIFAVYMWWNVLDPSRQEKVREKKVEKGKQIAPEFGGMLSAWQDHQRELTKENQAHDATLSSDDRGSPQ